MVKIRNIFGDEYKGKQGNAVYQKFYGKQIRRLWDGRKKNRAPQQEEQKRRFKIGLAFWSSLSTAEREFLKEWLREHGVRLTAQQWAVKVALSRPRAVLQATEVKANVEEWASDWDAIGWRYRQAITITNNTATDLTDFQVKLELDSSNVGANFDWSRQGADLRFYDEAGNKLDYYVEAWDVQNKQATVWVKVTSIQANGSTSIKMYYGNAEAQSESNAEEVFEFFDDFEGTTLDPAWTDYGKAWAIKELTGTGELHLKTGTNYFYALGYSGYTFTDGVIEARIKPIALAPRVAARIQDYANLYDARINVTADFMAIDKIIGGSETKIVSYDTQIDQVWYVLKFTVVGTSLKFTLYDDAGGEIHTLTATASDLTSGNVGFNSWGGSSGQGEFYVDWIRVRKYAEQEPTVTLGSEEIGVTYKEGSKTIYVKAIEHVAIKKVELYDEQGQLLGTWDDLSNLAEGRVTSVWRVPDEVAEQTVKAVVYSLAGTVDIVQW